MLSISRFTCFVFLSILTVPNIADAQQRIPIRQRVSIFASRRPCDPAEVKAYALGRQPVDAILAQVEVSNNSAETISAIKLGWQVYDEATGHRIGLSSCEDRDPAPSALLAGTTDVIQLNSFPSRSTVVVGLNPLPLPSSAPATIFVDHPFVTAGDLKSLSGEAGDSASAKRFALVISVAEIRFADGKSWTAAAR